MERTLLNPFPRSTQVKVSRRRVLQHDLDMFAAISGKRPAPGPMRQQHPAMRERSIADRGKAWSPSVLSFHLGNLSMPRIAARMVSPEIADWVRRLSAHAIQRLQQAQERLAAARPSMRHRPHDSSPHLN